MLNKLKPKSEFSRSVLTLMTGSTIAQAIPIAISPILTRVYAPEDFGVYALYMSIAGLFSLIATGRYELAIMLPKKDSDAMNIVFLSVIITFIIALITFLIILFFNQRLTTLLGNQSISNWLYFVPLTVLITGMYQSFFLWNNRKRHYKKLAMNKVIKSGATGSINLGMGFYGLGASGLIFGEIIGQTSATVALGKTIWKEDNKLFNHPNKLKIFALMKKYKKLPLLNGPNAFIDGLRLSGISILIAKFFTTATLGQFSLAWRMLQAPMALLGSSLSQVFFQKVSSANKQELYSIVKKFIIKASLIISPVFLIIYFFSVDIFTFIFGEKWQLAGESASIMSCWLFLNFLSSPLSTIFIVLNKQEITLIFSIFFMAIPLSIIFIFKSLSFIDVLSLVTFSMSMMLIVFILMVLHYTKKEQDICMY